jgi:hypothetical protein
VIEYRPVQTLPEYDKPVLVRGPAGHCIAKYVHHQQGDYWIALADGIEVEVDSANYCPEPTEWAPLD